MSDNSCTINAGIYNKGKDKEKNVEISMPSGLKMSLISSDYSSVKTEDGKIIIDRVLPKQKISIVALIEGVTEINKKLKPEIKSEDANGKTFLGQDNVPPSMGIIVGGMSLFLFFGGSVWYMESVDSNALIYLQNKYYQFKYDKLHEQGFSFSISQKKEGIDKYTLKNTILPVKLLDISEENGYINYTFDIYNPTDKKIEVNTRFFIDDLKSYTDELIVINKKSKDKSNDYNSELWIKYFDDIKSVYDKYNIEYTLEKIGSKLIPKESSSNQFILKPEAHEIIKIKRKINPKIKDSEYGVVIDITNDDDNSNESLHLIFKPENSHKNTKFEEIKNKK